MFNNNNNNNNNDNNNNILPPPENVEQLHSMLCEFMSNTEKSRRLAVENTIQRCLTRPEFLFMFLQLLRMDPNAPGLRPGARQLAAVLLRKKLLTLWRVLDLEKQAELKSILLDLLGKEPGRPERLAIAALIVVIAKVELRDGHCGWPELLQSLLDACKGGNPDFVELSLKIIATTAEPLMNLLRVVKTEKKKRRENVNVVSSQEEDVTLQLVRDAVANSLQNGQTVAVRIAALEALNAILGHIHGTGNIKRDLLNRLLPAAFECVVQAAGTGSGEGLAMALKTLEVLGDILELQGKAQHQFVFQAIEFLSSTVTTKNINPRLRERALDILGDFVTNRPKAVFKNGFHTRFFNMAMDLMSEDTSLALAELSADADAEHGFNGADDEDDEDLLDDTDMVRIKPICVVGGRMVRVLSMNLPSKIFAPLVIAAASSSTMENDPLKLKASMVALGVAAEGCSSQLRRQLPAIMTMTTNLFSSSVSFVRESAAFALGLFCRHLQPEILGMSDRTLPLLLAQLDQNTDENIRVSASRSLELLCETLDRQAVDPFAEELLAKLMGVLTSGTVGPSTQFNICGVISSIIETLSPPFINRGEDIIRVLMNPLSKPINSHNDMMLRSKVMETVGVTALAIGAQRFGPFFNETWSIVRASLDYNPSGQDVSELHESCFSFIANMARAGGDDLFGANVEGAVRKALDVLNDDSYIKVKQSDPLGARRNEARSQGIHQNNNDNDDDEDDEDNNGNNNNNNNNVIYENPNVDPEVRAFAEASERGRAEDGGGAKDRLSVRVADVDMRCGAIHAIGQLAESCPRSFSPFVNDACDVLLDNVNHFYTGVKENALEALAHVVVSLRHEFGESNIEIFRNRSPPRDSLPPKMRSFVDKYISDAIMYTLQDEVERSVVAAACTGLITVIETLGSVAIHPFIDALVNKAIVPLLRKEASVDAANLEFESGDDTSDDDEGGVEGDEDGNPDGEAAGTVARNTVDHDHELIDALGELIEAIVIAYGPDFAQFVQPIAQALDPYCHPDRPGEDHVMAMGTLAEIANRIGPAVAPYFNRCLELAFNVLENTDELVAKVNSCFMFSALAKNAPEQFRPDQVQKILADLWILLQTCKELKENATGDARSGLGGGDPEKESQFGGPEEVVRCEDNAVSAVCSLIKAGLIPFGGPIENVLNTVFELVPPKADLREAENCITALAHLCSNHADTIANHNDGKNIAVNLLKCCGKCLAANRVSENDKQGLASNLKATVFNTNMKFSGFFIEASKHVSPPRFANALQQLIKK